MKLLEMMSLLRLRLNDYEASNQKIASWLGQADRHVFNDVGGVKNPIIADALQETVSDVVSESRAVVVLKNAFAIKPTAMFQGKVCHVISKTAALSIDDHPAFKPAVTLEGRRVTFYYDKPYYKPNDPSRKAVFPVSVSYVRNPKSLLYLGGFQGVVTDGSYGISGKTNLKLLLIDWPEARPNFDTNELAGAYVSLQTSADERTDYLIEEHETGVLGKLFVNASGQSVEYVDTAFQLDINYKGFRATIQRGSEMPEAFHQSVIERAVELARGEKEKK